MSFSDPVSSLEGDRVLDPAGVDEADVSREDLEAMRPLLFAIAEIPQQFPDAIRLGLTRGLLGYGRNFVVFVNTAARTDPNRFLALSDQLQRASDAVAER